MKSHVRCIPLSICLLAVQALVFGQSGQAQPPQQPPPPATGTQQPPATPPAQTPPVNPTPPGPGQVPPLTPGPPPPPPPPDEYKNFSDISVELYYWGSKMEPVFRPGAQNADTTPVGLDFPGNGKPAEGIIVTAPAGRGNQLEFSYFTTKAQGNVTTNTGLTLFSQFYSQGDIIASGYKIQSAKITWNYLTYPDPPGKARFRFRTIYGVEFTSVSAHFDAPQDVNAQPVQGSRTIIFPTLGVGMEYHFSKRLYFAAKADGFTWPHKSAQADGSAEFYIRPFSRLDVIVGYKDMYFKTSPNSDYYMKGNIWGPFGGLRWTFK